MRKKQGPVKHIVQGVENGEDSIGFTPDGPAVPGLEDVLASSSSPAVTENQLTIDPSQSEDILIPNQFVENDEEDDDVMEILAYQLDDQGVGKLPDGTIVVEPMAVDDEPNFSNLVNTNEVTPSNARKPSAPIPPKSNKRSSSKSQSGHNSDIAITSVRTPGVLDLVKCTRCAEKFDPFHNYVGVHPSLLVLMCKRCVQLYKTSQELERDPKDNKDCQCRWCIGYGDLFCCDVCSNSFCRRCIKRNLGRSALTHVQNLGENDTWLCYVCEPQPLSELREECNKVLHEVLAYKEAQRRRTERRSAPGNVNDPGGSGIINNSTRSLNEKESSDVVYIGDSGSEDEAPHAAPPTDRRNISTMNQSALKSIQISTPNPTTIPTFSYAIPAGLLSTNNGMPNLQGSLSPSSVTALLQQLQGILPLQTVSLNNAPIATPPPAKVQILSNNKGGPRPWSAVSSSSNGLPAPLQRPILPNTSSYSPPPDTYTGRSERESSLLHWLRDSRIINAQNIGSILHTCLRTIACFYQDIRRLQVMVQKENSTVQERVDCLKTFRNTYENYFYGKLAKPLNQQVSKSVIGTVASLNNAMNRGSLPSHTAIASKGPFQRQPPSTIQRFISPNVNSGVVQRRTSETSSLAVHTNGDSSSNSRKIVPVTESNMRTLRRGRSAGLPSESPSPNETQTVSKSSSQGHNNAVADASAQPMTIDLTEDDADMEQM